MQLLKLTIAIFFLCIFYQTQADEMTYAAPQQDELMAHIEDTHRGRCQIVPSIGDDFQLYALAPKHLAYTTQAQPILYWYVSQPVTGKMTLSISQLTDINEFVEPLIDESFEIKVEAGIQVLPLAEHDVYLEVGVEYQWALSLHCDANDQSSNITTVRLIKYHPLSADLLTQEKQLLDFKLPIFYANQQFWYDALAALNDQLAKRLSEQAQLKQWRTLLFEQGQLSKTIIESIAKE